MTNRRRREIEKVRAEGREAAVQGKHRGTNPYSTSNADWFQWVRGYDEEQKPSSLESIANQIAEDLMSQNMLDVPIHVALPVIEDTLRKYNE